MALPLPARYRANGLFLVLAGLTGFWVASTNGLINLYRVILPGDTLPDGSYPYPANFWEINAALEVGSLCSVAVGIVAVFLAREPDEYFYRIRLESLQFALFAQFLTGLLAFAYFYLVPGYQLANTVQGIMGLSFGSFLVTYVLRYYFVIYFKTGQD